MPLNPGNVWIYKTTHRGFITLRVDQEKEFNGTTYSLLKGLPSGDAWLRSDDHGTIYEMDPSGQQPEKVWYDFGAPLGERYTTAIPGTGSQAVIHSRSASFTGRIGSFDNALEVLYPNATQPGIASDTFLPWVGMVYRSELAGIVEAHWELVYASLGGVTIVTQPETSFAIAVDDQSKSVRLTVRNTSREPLVLHFSSGQRYDIAVSNSKGERVYVWSADKLFAQVLGTESILGERTWMESLPALSPGNYVAEGFLTTSGGISFRATVAFSVPEVTTQK